MSEQTYTIKGLEWKPLSNGAVYAETPFSSYTAWGHQPHFFWCNSREDTQRCASLEAAQAAAEQHYRERLSQALLPVLTNDSPADGLREAAGRVLREGTRTHGSIPDYVLIEPDAWKAAQQLAAALGGGE